MIRRLACSTLLTAFGALTAAAAPAHAGAGDRDATFGSNGSVITPFSSAGSSSACGRGIARDVEIQADGRIVAAGCHTGPAASALARYTDDGLLDRSFGAGGKVEGPAPGIHALEVQRDGRLLAAGSFGSTPSAQSALRRYTPAGGLDAGFGSGGTTTWGEAEVAGLALQTDGGIVTVGSSGPFEMSTFDVRRFAVDGSPDGTFGSGGRADTAIAGNAARALDVAVQPDGKIVVAGEARVHRPPGPPDMVVARYNADGSADRGFGADGVVVVGGPALGESVALQPDGKIVVVGGTAVVRFMPDGSFDAGFGSGGRATFTGSAADVELQADGKLVVSGGDRRNGCFALARYSAAGVPDSSFSRAPLIASCRFAGDGITTAALALQQDGRLVVAGENSPENGFLVARYEGDPTTEVADIVASRPLSSVIARGLPAAFSCAGPCTMRATLLVSPGVVASAAQSVVAGRGTRTLRRAGTARVIVRLTAKARRGFRKRRRVTATLVTRLTQRGGRPKVRRQRVRLVR